MISISRKSFFTFMYYKEFKIDNLNLVKTKEIFIIIAK